MPNLPKPRLRRSARTRVDGHPAQQAAEPNVQIVEHVARNVPQPKTPDNKQPERSPTTSTGLPVEDQVRKEWDPRRGGGLPTF